jgi:hypothetical protein
LATPRFEGEIGDDVDENSVAEGDGDGAAQWKREANGEFWLGDLGNGLFSCGVPWPEGGFGSSGDVS